MAKSLKHGMLSVLIANIINLGFSLLSNFLLPKYLSVETYAQLKTFQLYATYAGLLHLGFVDGLYLKYGGKNIADCKPDTIETNLSTLRLFQLVITCGAVTIGLLKKDPILVAFGISILPANMMSCFKLLYQAVGEFDIYSRVINGTTISYFILNMIFIFILKTDNPYFYISVYIVVDVVLWIFLELFLHRKYKITFRGIKFSMQELTDNIKTGVLLTLGNLSSTFLTGMDRWFIKALMESSVPFAQYSFAVSMENFMNVAVTPVSVTLYNFFCREKEPVKIRKIRNSMQIFAAFIIACAFPAKFILENYLTKYLASVSVMFYLFGAQLFYIVIKSIYVNLYKANKRQREYFIKIVLVIFIGAVLNAVCFYFYRQKEAFAIGTLLSAIIWWFLCYRDHQYIGYSFKEFLYLLVIECGYQVCGNLMGAIIGLLAYLTFAACMSLLLLQDDFFYLLKNGKSLLLK